MKIGRNDPCPCGSGKKYKKCCLDNPIVRKMASAAKKVFKKVNPVFTAYNSFDLLQTIAGLTLLPENHGKYVRMELLGQTTIQNFNSKNKFVSRDELKNILDREYPSNHLEDPPVNLFTDLITFYGGDYLIFPGITENGSYVLSNLLAAIYHWPDSNIPEKFKNNCFHAALFILSVSDEIAKKLGYGRYQEGAATESEIFLPDQEGLEAHKEAVVFTQAEIEQLCKEREIAPNVINEFLIQLDPKEWEDATLEDSPFLYRPILKADGKYLVASPATLSYALTHFIWAEANKWGCMKSVNDAYHNGIWNNVGFRLGQFHFEQKKIEGLKHDTALPVKEAVFSFDSDKIAYVQFVYDAGLKYEESSRVAAKEAFAISELAEKQKNENIKLILSLPEFKNYQVLDFTILSSIGRDFFFPVKGCDEARVLLMPVSEFEVLVNLKDTNAIDLWKFAIAREEQLMNEQFIGFSFLDLYKLYKDHNDSFYLSDNTQYNFVHVQPGYAAEMVKESKLATDHHSMLIEKGGRIANSPVELKDRYAPVYLNMGDISSGKLRFALEGFHQPFWVYPKRIPNGISGELRHIYWELTDAITYWLWQIQAYTKEDLAGLGTKPVNVTFELNPIEKFENIDRNFERVNNLTERFQNEVNERTINVMIPHEITAFLYGADNEGERVLVRHLLKGINKLLEANHLEELGEARINEIIEASAPLGLKKKFFILDTGDNLMLDPRNLEPYRYVQDYDVGLVLNSIVPGLGKLCPPEGELNTKEEKEKLTRNIVIRVLLPALKKNISQYHSELLLQKLISLNESLIRRREELKLLTPTRIACFVTPEEQAEDLNERLTKINRTTIAIRCLIEHVAAEQEQGNKMPSVTDIDELIALEDQIIAWGSLGDQINYDLFDVKVGILKSRRVGTEKKVHREVFDPYHAAKTKEDVTDLTKSYEQFYPQRIPIRGKDTPEYLNKAFLEDFGIAFNRICEFLERLTIIGIQQVTPFAKLTKKQLQIEINKSEPKFENGEFENAINYLSLFERGKVENTPNGYESYDISPWRFNRRLSLLRKPVIIFENQNDKTDPTIYWGARQALASKVYLGDQIMTNRLRVAEDGKVIKALGKIAQERGDSLVKKVFGKLNQKDYIVDTEVPICSNCQFHDENDLGDIDVLAIDGKNKLVFSLECKNMAPSRNIKEMVEEVVKLFGSDSERGWIDKHLARDKWIKNNLEVIGKKYGIDLTGYAVKSLFVTDEDMLTPYLKKQALPIPFVTRYEIDTEGYTVLINK